LRSVGIDVDQVRHRLEATFGADAARAAERRVRRRPRWRGGHPAQAHCAANLLAKRAYQFAAEYADVAVTPRSSRTTCSTADSATPRTPFGTQLSRRSRASLATLGWTPGRPNPLRLLLQTRGIDPAGLATAHAGSAFDFRQLFQIQVGQPQ
jgi:hypothetical protein